MIDKIESIFGDFWGFKFQKFPGSMPLDPPTILTPSALVCSHYARASSPNPKNAARSLGYQQWLFFFRRRHSHWSILGLQCWFALHRPCVRRGILDLELYLSICDTLIVCCRYTWEIRPVYTWNTRILVRVYKTMENSKVTVYYYTHVTQIYCGIS